MVIGFSFRVYGSEVSGLALMVVKSLGFKVYALGCRVMVLMLRP